MREVPKRVSVIGIGSPHGDDQFGWVVTDCLSRRYGIRRRGIAPNTCLTKTTGPKDVTPQCVEEPKARSVTKDTPSDKRSGRWPVDEVCFYKTGNPVDLVPMLDEFDRIVVVDAAVGLAEAMPFRQLEYASAVDRESIANRPFRGTHEVGLQHSLQLAQTLGKRIEHVQIWLGRAISFDPLSNMTRESVTAVDPCVFAIERFLKSFRFGQAGCFKVSI